MTSAMLTAAAGDEDYVSYDDAMPSVDDLEVAAAAAEAPPMHQTLIGQGAALHPGAAWRSIGGAASSTSSDEVRDHHPTAIVRSGPQSDNISRSSAHERTFDGHMEP